MKKLLFFTVAIGLFVGLHAQQVQVRESASMLRQNQEAEKMMAQPVKSATMLNAGFQKSVQKSHKATTDVNYGDFQLISNAEFLRNQIGEQDIVSEAGTAWTFDLFPDSLASKLLHYMQVDTSRVLSSNRGAGFIFDPYSRDYDRWGDYTLFGPVDTLYGWKIDTLATYVDYRIVNYDALSPDTLRFYAFTYDCHLDSSKDKNYYQSLVYTDAGRHFVLPKIDYPNPIPEKGGATKPQGPNVITWDYILSGKDSADVGPGRVGPRWTVFGIPGGGMEIDPGSVFGLVVKFIPGYNYIKDDTISIRHYDESQQKTIAEDQKLNSFSLFSWSYDVIDDDDDANWEQFLTYFDKTGYNTFFMESNAERYNFPKESQLLQGCYSHYYYVKTAFWLYLAQGDNFIVPFAITTTTLPNGKERAAYSQTLVANKEGSTWSLASGNLPTGLTLSSSGEISGTPTVAGTSSFAVKATNGTESDTKSLSITIAVGNPGIAQIGDVISNIYPNPATTQLTIDLKEEGHADVTIYNVLGQAIQQESLNNLQTTIDIANLPAGVYMVKVMQNNKAHTVKLFKE